MEQPISSIERRLAELGLDPAAVVDDRTLWGLLDPLRGAAPLRVICGRHGCHQTVSWWGLPAAGTPLGLAPILVREPGGVALPRVDPNVPDEQPPTGYVYGVGPWTVEGARVIFGRHGPKPHHGAMKLKPESTD